MNLNIQNSFLNRIVLNANKQVHFCEKQYVGKNQHNYTPESNLKAEDRF